VVSRRYAITVVAVAVLSLAFSARVARAQLALVPTIASAISGAFPSLKSVFATLFGSDNKKATTDQKQEQNSLQKTAESGQKALKSVAAELSTIAAFLADCQIAESNVALMRGELAGKNAMDSETRTDVSADWRIVKAHIEHLASGSTRTQIAGLGADPFVQTTLNAVINHTNGPDANIEAYVTTGDISRLEPALRALDGDLTSVNVLGALVISDVSQGLTTAADAAAPSQGIPPPAISISDKAILMQVLSRQ
jgi:hypothetical protein